MRRRKTGLPCRLISYEPHHLSFPPFAGEGPGYWPMRRPVHFSPSPSISGRGVIVAASYALAESAPPV
jgi:hypothetical protein